MVKLKAELEKMTKKSVVLDIREIRRHMESVHDTEKVTNAMHMIAATKMRRAKSELDATRPYFDAVRNEIKRVFRVDTKIESKYLYPAGEHDLPGAYAYLVITADSVNVADLILVFEEIREFST